MSGKFDRRRFLAETAAATGALSVGLSLSARGADDGAWGDLTGRLIYDGIAPPRAKLTVDKDVACCGKFDIRDETLMVDENGGLQNVYIYVRSRGVKVCPELKTTVKDQVLLDNKNCIFVPHCMSIWYPEQEYFIQNSDPVAQNVAFNPLLDNPANIVIAVGGTATWNFGRSQRAPVPVACNYHPWESAYVLPLDHPYVAITEADGTFKIPKLPVGKLDFQVWHERVGYFDTPEWPKGRLEVTIKPGVNDLGQFKLSPSLFEKK